MVVSGAYPVASTIPSGLLKEFAQTEPDTTSRQKGQVQYTQAMRKIRTWETMSALSRDCIILLLGLESNGVAWSPVNLNPDECCFTIIFKSIVLIPN